MSDAQRLIDKASEFLTAAIKASSQESHAAKVNIAQTAALISIAISLNKITEGGLDDHTDTHCTRKDRP